MKLLSPVTAAFSYFGITDDPPTPHRTSADIERCNDCHAVTSFHGSNRNNGRSLGQPPQRLGVDDETVHIEDRSFHRGQGSAASLPRPFPFPFPRRCPLPIPCPCPCPCPMAGSALGVPFPVSAAAPVAVPDAGSGTDADADAEEKKSARRFQKQPAGAVSAMVEVSRFRSPISRMRGSDR